tara:strand:- start:183 stop:422 length:240 start_codon:yes stop_codon:yes gene_type:complete
MVNEADLERLKEGQRGPLDLEQRIEDLIKQKEYLQFQCRKAATAILEQEVKYNSLTREFDKMVEENSNLKVMMSSKNAK